MRLCLAPSEAQKAAHIMHKQLNQISPEMPRVSRIASRQHQGIADALADTAARFIRRATTSKGFRKKVCQRRLARVRAADNHYAQQGCRAAIVAGYRYRCRHPVYNNMGDITPLQEPGWDARSVRRFLQQRVGGQGRVRAWYSHGEVVNLGNGAVVANVEGLEFVALASDSGSRTLELEDAGQLMGTLLARKILVFRDRTNGEYMSQFRMSPQSPAHAVDPMLMHYQKLDFFLMGSLLKICVQLNAERAVRTFCHIIPFRTFSPRFTSMSRFWDGDLGPIRDSPNEKKKTSKSTMARRGFWERYEWFKPMLGAGTSTWIRVGTCPSWYGPGKCAYSVQSRSVPSIREVPAKFRSHLEAKYPTFCQPITTLDEVDELQEGLPRAVPQDKPLQTFKVKSGKRALFKLG